MSLKPEDKEELALFYGLVAMGGVASWCIGSLLTVLISGGTALVLLKTRGRP